MWRRSVGADNAKGGEEYATKAKVDALMLGKAGIRVAHRTTQTCQTVARPSAVGPQSDRNSPARIGSRLGFFAK